MKTLSEIKNEINPEELYRPMQIAKNQWMFGFQGKNAYYYILKLIQKKKLRAKNLGLGKVPYFRVPGSELLRFIQKITKI